MAQFKFKLAFRFIVIVRSNTHGRPYIGRGLTACECGGLSSLEDAGSEALYF